MSNRQAIALMIGLTMWLLAVLFPPRVMKEAPSLQVSRGFLFSSTLYRHQTYDPVTRMGTSVTNYAIDKDRLLMEWAAAVLATAVAFVLFRRWRTPQGR